MDGRDNGPIMASRSGAHRPRSEVVSQATRDFSLVCGGPFYKFLLRIGLVKPPLKRVGWRAVVITLIAWAPLLLLTTLSGCLLSGVRVPFLYDVETQVRLLLGLPLLIIAELSINRGISTLLPQFVEQQIITPATLPKFEHCIESALRLRNSGAGESWLLALVIIGGNFLLRGVVAAETGTWYTAVGGASHTLSPAGYWYVFVSLPIVEFICLRWYYRLFIWARLLWQISRIDLNLIPCHPDRRCGLGFLGQIVLAIAPFVLAHSVVLSGFVANGILYEGGKLPQYGLEIAVMAMFLLLLAVGPLFVFTSALIEKSKAALYSYGSLSSEYVNEFEKKWIHGQRPDDESLIGNPDIQSLADLANSFNIVQHIVPIPFTKETLFYLAGLVVLPLLPLLLTMFSAQEMAERLLKVLF